MDNYINDLIEKFIKEKQIRITQEIDKNGFYTVKNYNEQGQLISSIKENLQFEKDSVDRVVDSIINEYDEGLIKRTIHKYKNGDGVNIQKVTLYDYNSNTKVLKLKSVYLNGEFYMGEQYNFIGNLYIVRHPNGDETEYSYNDGKTFINTYNDKSELIYSECRCHDYTFTKRVCDDSLPQPCITPSDPNKQFYIYTLNTISDTSNDTISVICNSANMTVDELMFFKNSLFTSISFERDKLKTVRYNQYVMIIRELVKKQIKNNTIVNESILDNKHYIQINNDKGEPISTAYSDGNYEFYEYDEEDVFIKSYRSRNMCFDQKLINTSNSSIEVVKTIKNLNDVTCHKLCLDYANGYIDYTMIVNGIIAKSITS